MAVVQSWHRRRNLYPLDARVAVPGTPAFRPDRKTRPFNAHKLRPAKANRERPPSQVLVAPATYVPRWRPAPLAADKSVWERVRWLPQRAHAVLGVTAVVYLLSISFYLLLNGGWPTPDLLVPPLLLLAAAARRGWTFIIDWLPLLMLVLVYEAFRGIADDLNGRVAFWPLINADQLMFGGVTGPEYLQERFFDPVRTAWYDWTASLLYSAHYITPVALGFALWLRSRALFWRFSLSLVFLFGAGFVSYYFYPAAPPWMASEMGLIAPIDRVLIHTLSNFGATEPFALAYQEFSPNPVAAMPSLHAALPVLLTLIIISIAGPKALPLLAYPLVGGFFWVYLGEHYLIDVLIGWLYGAVAFLAVWAVLFPKITNALRAATLVLLPDLRYQLKPLPSWLVGVAALAFIAYQWLGPAGRI